MFVYNLRLALLSLRRTPVLSLLIVSAIGLGIGVCISILTVYALMIEDPVPDYSDRLFTYKLNNQPELVGGRSNSDPLRLVGYRDALNIASSEIPRFHSLHYQTAGVFFPLQDGQTPFRDELRFANAGFFRLHRVPFQYGGHWSHAEEVKRPYETVVTNELNEKLFAGANSVGKDLKIGANFYKIVGVMDEFAPVPAYMELDAGSFSKIDGALIPFSLTPELSIRKSGGNINCSADPDGDTWLAFLEAECSWIHHWVELNDAESVNAFKAFLDDYALDQRQYGRFLGPFDNELHDVMSWLEDWGVVNKDYEILLSIAFLFLVVCLLNCIGLLLAKFLGRTAEMSLRRAVGASRRIIFKQHLVEVSLIGFLGGCLGLGVSLIGLTGIRSLYRQYERLTHLDVDLVLIAILLAIGSTLLAGLYPAWRVGQLPISRYLKGQ